MVLIENASKKSASLYKFRLNYRKNNKNKTITRTKRIEVYEERNATYLNVKAKSSIVK
jgi:hypothetical protein